jgi:thiol:disulfide interchange protein DsbD
MKYLLKLLAIFVFSLTSVNAGDFLMPDEAFQPYAKVNDKMQIETGVVLGKDIYLYAKKLTIEIKDSSLSILKKESPKTSEHSGEQVYLTSPNFVISLENKEALKGVQKFTLVLSYQGCSELGLCYNPYTKEYPLSIDVSKLPTTSNTLQKVEKKIEKETQKVEKEVVELSETDAIANSIKSGNIVVVLLTFLGFGLLLAMTPCVFPMIPIISGVIVSQGEGLTTKKAFALSVVYVLAMAVAYTIAGVLAGLFGANLQAALQMPWVIYSFSFVFVALAFSMFGYYELKLPDSLVAKVSSSGERGGYAGVAIMGFLSALIVGPCVAAPLAGALVYIGQTGDALLGGMALFSMSIGMGLPLIVVGVSAGKFMPKPGAWMTMVTAIFGIMMLGVAIWMLEKIVDSSVTTLLYGLLGIGTAIYLGAFEKEGHIFKKSVSIIIFIYSVALFLSFLAGEASMTKPLGFLKGSSVVTTTAATQKELKFEVVQSISELDALLEKNKGKKILLDFSAEWCTSCKEFEEITFVDPKVVEKMSEFVLIRADVTQNRDEQKALSKAYGVFGPPAIIFFDENLKVKKSKTVVGFVEPAEFLAHLNSL